MIEVGDGLERHWFAYFGLPKILQSDNGKEFKNAYVVNKIKTWDGECQVIYGRPRHPQSQGLVEQSNGTVERMLAAGMEQNKTEKWSSLLPIIQFNLFISIQPSLCLMKYF